MAATVLASASAPTALEWLYVKLDETFAHGIAPSYLVKGENENEVRGRKGGDERRDDGKREMQGARRGSER